MRKIAFFLPGSDFPSLSVTGGSCELICDHCQGRYLKGMTPVRDPEELIAIAKELTARGASGLLLSGGCDRKGKVPLSPYIAAIKDIKRTTPLRVNLHPGLVNDEEARELASSGADRISFDLVLDGIAISERMHLENAPQGHLRSFHALCSAAPGRVTPHILLGLGEERSELEAIRVAGQENVPCLILLSLIGSKVDGWEERLLNGVRTGVSTGKPVLLGCMRPRGRPDVEMRALEAGAAGIVAPAKAMVLSIEENGWKGVWHRECCALYR